MTATIKIVRINCDGVKAANAAFTGVVVCRSDPRERRLYE